MTKKSVRKVKPVKDAAAWMLVGEDGKISLLEVYTSREAARSSIGPVPWYRPIRVIITPAPRKK